MGREPGEEVEARVKELLQRIDAALKKIESLEVPSRREEVARALEEIQEAVAELRGIGKEARGAGGIDEDIIELKAVLDIVTPFLEKLGGILKDVLNAILEQFNKFMDGKKLGEDIGNFYNALKSTGLPDDVIKEMVRDYYKKRMEAVPPISELLRQIISMIEMREGAIGPKILISKKDKEKSEEPEEKKD